MTSLTPPSWHPIQLLECFCVCVDVARVLYKIKMCRKYLIALSNENNVLYH